MNYLFDISNTHIPTRFFNIFRNKLYTSAMLTITIIIIIILLYPVKSNTPSYVLLKLGFYIFLASISFIIMHGSALHNDNKKSKEDNDISNITDATNGGNITLGNMPVHPNTRNTMGGNSSNIFNMYGV